MRKARYEQIDIGALSQHGLVTAAQLEALQVPGSTVDAWAATGRLVRCGRATFRLPGAPETPHQLLLASCLDHDGLASHRSGAALRNLHGFTLVPPEITVVRGGTPRRSEPPRGTVVVHETRDLRSVRGPEVAGVPTTSPERLAVDLAWLTRHRELGRARFDDAVEELVRRGHTSWVALDRACIAASRARSPGVDLLRAVVREYLGDGAESRLERRFLRLVADAGIPPPREQVVIRDRQGFVMRVDAAWIDRRVGVELDSVRYHLRRDAFEADRAKRNRARLAGWLLLEFTSRQIRDEPDRVVTEVGRALGLD